MPRRTGPMPRSAGRTPRPAPRLVRTKRPTRQAPRLTGHSLLLTRSADDAAPWAETLASEGARTVVLPCLSTEITTTPASARRFSEALARADWLVVTSRRGADAAAALLNGKPPARLKLAAVGSATAKRLCEHFGQADLAGPSTAAALGAELAAQPEIQRARCVLALAENAGSALTAALEAAGAEVERFDVYRTIPAPPLERKRPLSKLGCDTVVFASPSAVTGFGHQVDVDTACRMVTIGPSTSAAVRAHGWTVAAEAREPSLSGLIESLLESAHG